MGSEALEVVLTMVAEGVVVEVWGEDTSPLVGSPPHTGVFRLVDLLLINLPMVSTLLVINEKKTTTFPLCFLLNTRT